MNDIERTRKWLQCCRDKTNDDLSENEDACGECPYFENGTCSPWQMFDDALELIERLISKRLVECTSENIGNCKDCKWFGQYHIIDEDMDIDWCFNTNKEGAVATLWSCEDWEEKDH